MDYARKNHSKYCLMAHLIFVCKYRKKLLVYYGNNIKRIFTDISSKYELNILEMEIDKDHIHILIQYCPNKSISDIVKLYKQISTYRILRLNNNYKKLEKCFWKEKTFWSNGYFVSSIGQVLEKQLECIYKNKTNSSPSLKTRCFLSHNL